MLPKWALKEKDLGGWIFTSSKRLIPPTQRGYSALWDGCLLVTYEGDEIPYGAAVVFDKNEVPIGLSIIKRGQLIRIWPTFIKEESNGNISITLKMKHAYRRGINEKTVPEFYAYYVIRATLSWNIKTSVYDLIRVAINGTEFSTNPEDWTHNLQYFCKLISTVTNELIYLSQPIENLDSYRHQIQRDADKYYKSFYRYKNFLFFLDHMKYVLQYDREEKEFERSRCGTTIVLESIPRGNGITDITVNPTRTIPREEPKYDRAEYAVHVKPVKDIAISTKSSKTSGKAYIINDKWFIVTWPDEHAHAFWVCKLVDKGYFLEKQEGNKYLYRRSAATPEHPIWRFYHTPGGYAKLRQLCGF